MDPISDVPSTPLDIPIGINGMNPVDFWNPTHQQALRTLGAAPLLDSTGHLVATPLLDTNGGRSVLGHVVRCALGKTTTVESGASSFTGEFGLAPDWSSRSLNASEQRWLTSCLLVLLNGLGARVWIGLVGSNPALVGAPGQDSSAYTIPDMTAFGNVFLETSKAYVCADVPLNLACGLSLSAYTLLRLCGLSATCGATHLGTCSSLLPIPIPSVCAHDAAGNPTCSASGTTYAEAISTKVKSSLDLSLNPVCSLL